ncbi:MAG: DUF2501 domain-containing protein [Candidatus Accumulibacter meliphilus]|jgi:hypothetical protein|uniref:DUF2501 domain-containing protein n=1 Tax=Candidatus Accumulibacter meliphilus TaxID=2211374 RepID=A0A369XJK0_9PROT|nr:MAG: DUF2501 domain-containing protein [Candidatus Accumulibacter meliphilus]
MNVHNAYRTATAILIAAFPPFSATQAQLGDLIKQGGNAASGASGGLGGLGDLGGALSVQSVTSGSAGNVAGLLEFCIKNNYLSGDKAAEVKNSLTSKLPGGSSSSDSGYKSGKKGILNSSDGSALDLSGGGLKKQATKQICDTVLDQGKSFL